MEPLSQATSLLTDAVDQAAEHFPGSEATLIQAPVNGIATDIVMLAFPPATHLYFIPSAHFPDVPPTLLIQWETGGTRQFRAIDWPPEGSPADKIRAALETFIAPSEDYLPAYGYDPAYP